MIHIQLHINDPFQILWKPLFDFVACNTSVALLLVFCMKQKLWLVFCSVLFSVCTGFSFGMDVVDAVVTVFFSFPSSFCIWTYMIWNFWPFSFWCIRVLCLFCLIRPLFWLTVEEDIDTVVVIEGQNSVHDKNDGILNGGKKMEITVLQSLYGNQ